MENNIILTDILDDINIETANKVFDTFSVLSKTFSIMVDVEETIKTERPR